jgi:hypothetical protein
MDRSPGAFVFLHWNLYDERFVILQIVLSARNGPRLKSHMLKASETSIWRGGDQRNASSLSTSSSSYTNRQSRTRLTMTQSNVFWKRLERPEWLHALKAERWPCEAGKKAQTHFPPLCLSRICDTLLRDFEGHNVDKLSIHNSIWSLLADHHRATLVAQKGKQMHDWDIGPISCDNGASSGPRDSPPGGPQRPRTPKKRNKKASMRHVCERY